MAGREIAASVERGTLTRASRRLQKRATAAPLDLSRRAGEVISEAASRRMVVRIEANLLIAEDAGVVVLDIGECGFFF